MEKVLDAEMKKLIKTMNASTNSAIVDKVLGLFKINSLQKQCEEDCHLPIAS